MDTCKRIGMLRRRRVREIIESGTADDIVSCCYAEDQRYPGFGRGRTEGQYQHRPEGNCTPEARVSERHADP